MKHYLQVTDADFDQASQSGAESGARVAQNAAQRAHGPHRTDSQETTKAPDVSRAYANTCDDGREYATSSSGEDRIRTSTENAEKSETAAPAGAESGAVPALDISAESKLQLLSKELSEFLSDDRISELIDRWPSLTENARQQILSIAKDAEVGRPNE